MVSIENKIICSAIFLEFKIDDFSIASITFKDFMPSIPETNGLDFFSITLLKWTICSTSGLLYSNFIFSFFIGLVQSGILSCCQIFKSGIDKEPFETLEETYERGWFIIKNYDNYDYNELISQSIININSKKGMEY